MSDTITGRTVGGRYQVTGYLRGARMGDLYVGRRADDQQRVTIKILDPKLFHEPEAVARFERELRVTREIDDACSMKVLDHGKTEEGVPWIVLEYVEADALSEVLEEQGALGPERAARITGQIALALAAAHKLNVVHRDLQPAHVLLLRDQRVDTVKVTEFGLARVEKSEDESTLTAVGVRIGTPTYMAPEYIEDFSLDHRADLYALGVVLFEMLVGRPPFEGRPYKVMDQHLNAPVPRPSEQAEGVPAWLDELVARLMAKKPEDRIQSAAEVVRRVEQGLGARISTAPPPRSKAPPAPVFAPSRAQPVASVDPILVAMIKQNTMSVTRGRGGATSRRDALIVEKVGAPSIASEAGVRPGMFVELPDERSSGLRSLELYDPVAQKRRYAFSMADGSERIELVATGMPIGVDVMRSAENVRAYYDPLESPPDALLDLWKQKDWETLEKLALRTLTQQKGSTAGGFLSYLLGGGSSTPTMKLRNHPALVLYGAALIEQKKPGARELVEEFRSQHATGWPSIYNALAHYYLGRERAKQHPDQEAVDLLWNALQIWPLEPAAIVLEQIVHRRPEARAWVGRTFPDYNLDLVDGSGSDGLAATLERMDDSQLLLVCMMGGFRGNADYDAFMVRFLGVAAWFPHLVHGVHVVTTATVREKEHPEHYKGEDLVLRSGLRCRILEDYRAFVQRTVKPSAIPTIYAVDKDGTVVHEGALTMADLWESLSRAGRRRMEKLHGR